MHSTQNSKLGYSNILKSDLDEIITHNADHFRSLSGKRILILGGTGFVGKWLVAALLHSQRELSIEFEVTIATREIEKAKTALVVSGEPRIYFIEHDLKIKSLGNQGKFDVLVHGATPSVPSTGSFNEKAVRDASKNATLSILNSSQNGSRILNLSSGAVLGEERTTDGLVEESRSFGKPRNPYAVTKIEIEKDFENYVGTNQISVSHARLFAFSGPFISLTDHFAVGNFMKNVIENSNIVVKGNPETTRSYMYPTDLITSLIRLIPRSDISHINVGNPNKLSIRDIAESFSALGGNLPIQYDGDDQMVSSYVPEIHLLSESLHVHKFLDLEPGIDRWRNWLTIIS